MYKRQLLETTDLREQCTLLITMLINEAQIASIRTQLAAKLKEKIDKNQRDYILREQMDYIRNELGDKDEDSELAQFSQALEKLKADKEIKDKIKKEISRYKTIMGASSESAVQRGYIETLLELPWNKVSKDTIDTVSYTHLFFAGVGVGLVLACASARFPIIEEIFSPVLSLIKAVPVASFVVLFLIWWHSDMLSTAISFCVVLPNIYILSLIHI